MRKRCAHFATMRHGPEQPAREYKTVFTGIVIAAPRTGCRHQMLDGTGRLAQHSFEILRAALP